MACFTGPNSPSPDGPSNTCPVLRWNGITYWPFSYIDNRMALNVTGYNGAKSMVGQLNIDNVRYIWQISVDAVAATATFYGQANAHGAVPWTKLPL